MWLEINKVRPTAHKNMTLDFSMKELPNGWSSSAVFVLLTACKLKKHTQAEVKA